MKILICPDSFKDSLSSAEICEVLSNTFHQQKSIFNVATIPMADGGEGTLEVIHSLGNTKRVEMISLDPLGRDISSFYLWDNDIKTVFIELAQCSGIERLSKEERNCMHTSTYGTGMQILDAIEKYDPKRLYLAVGSSATNDGGLGMLSAMGVDVIDQNEGRIERPKGKDMINISSIDVSASFSDLLACIEFIVINDVNNPFSGKNGAAYTYAKQKGASSVEIEKLDRGLEVIRDIVKADMGINLDEVSGSGAAGGIAGGAYAYLGASMISGTDFVSEVTNLSQAILNADLVITGEGRLDHQTLSGKLVHHVSDLCKSHNKDLIVICGANEVYDNELDQLGNPKVYALNEYNAGSYTDETTRRDLKRVVEDIVIDLAI